MQQNFQYIADELADKLREGSTQEALDLMKQLVEVEAQVEFKLTDSPARLNSNSEKIKQELVEMGIDPSVAQGVACNSCNTQEALSKVFSN